MTEEQLQALILYDITVWESYLPYLAAQIKQEIAFGVFAGLSEEEILANVTTKALTANQLETIIATALANYSRSVTYGVMQEEPNDVLYAYIGPIDGRTRTECLNMGSSQPLTQKEIINNFGQEVLYRGGGYNCRHKWRSIGTRVKYAKRFYNPDKAGALLQDD
tara:strand:- start:495 stop:986 length:492 start_codon:yes stop_codon:yes gene_type:complete